MGIQLVVIAAFFVALSNLCFRKGMDAGGSAKSYLFIMVFTIFILAIGLNPMRTGNYEWSNCMAAFGFTGGIILAALLAFLGKALEYGPPGLSFASISSSTVLPAVLMVIIFGTKFGYHYTLWNGVGSVLVLAGLFWAGWGAPNTSNKMKWIGFLSVAFVMHVLFLSFMQWRALFIHFPGENGLLLSFDTEDAISQWFMPMIYLSTAFINLVIYCVSLKRLPTKRELYYGVAGGLANGTGTFFLIWATEAPTSTEHAVMFPIYAVSIVILCNLWGQWLYREKINWWASVVCVLGLLVGTIDWKALS